MLRRRRCFRLAFGELLLSRGSSPPFYQARLLFGFAAPRGMPAPPENVLLVIRHLWLRLLIWNRGLRPFDEGLGFAHQDLVDYPIVPSLAEIVAGGFGKVGVGNFDTVCQRGARLFGLLELVLGHRQHGARLDGAIVIALVINDLCEPSRGFVEVAGAVLGQAFGELIVNPVRLIGAGRNCHVSHFLHGLQIGRRWRQ